MSRQPRLTIGADNSTEKLGKASIIIFHFSLLFSYHCPMNLPQIGVKYHIDSSAERSWHKGSSSCNNPPVSGCQ
jgi:hypothetical protein